MVLIAHRAPTPDAASEDGEVAFRLSEHTDQPRRSRRRQRSVDRLRFGLFLAAGLIGLSALSALPIAEDFIIPTLEVLSIVDDEPDEAEVASTASEDDGAEAVAVENQFDSGVWVDPQMVGVAPPGSVTGILTFRGSPTRTFYGSGPVPLRPEIAWRYPETGGLCRQSTVGADTRAWCGLGWTGQPALFERDDKLWAVFGALDGAVHFLDARSGETLFPRFQTDDIIKGSVTIDPDGFPIVYTGSRDNFYRAIAFDGEEPRELWRLDAREAGPIQWNNDWDGSGLVLDDYLFVGGENSRIHIAKLNRTYDDDGRVQVDPDLVFTAPGWDSDLLDAVGENVSIENSVAISGDTLYFANSGGLVQGWDISSLRDGVDPERVFRYWVGDDVDASLVIDDEGMLYVAAEFERNTARARELGQLLKLDPSRSGEDALIWSVQEQQGLSTGIWGTPALHEDTIVFGSEGGRLRAVDRFTGESLWEIGLGTHLWQSPVIVDGALLMGNCSGILRAYDVRDARSQPGELWALPLDEGCIEATPAVWDGAVVIGTRSGSVYGIRDAEG
ncbi:MAG: hypothetical protein EX269_08065 [Acidimicrobiales bacterium]|nr:MAG: hypothetical protein EX269_08065 [Acidimicrobiales bacterium]